MGTEATEVERIAALFPLVRVEKDGVVLLGRVQKGGALLASNGGFKFFMTDCCGGAATYSDDALCCKGCWYEVDFIYGDVYDPARHGSIVPPTAADAAIFFKGFAPRG